MSDHATTGLAIEEPLLFDLNSDGGLGLEFGSDVPGIDVSSFGTMLRDEPLCIPNLSEPQVIRHFTKLSALNYHKDLGLYPLGSCTMKHNPKIADKIVSDDSFSALHPLDDDDCAQGSLKIAHELERWLLEISGMDALTLWPAAGSHGELTGMLMVRAYHMSKNDPRKYVLIPDSAHGTNPSSAAICGYEVKELKSSASGVLDVETVANAMTKDVAAIMITNPNTLGLFEKNFKEIADVVHGKGGLVYCDGANLNALLGKVKPGEIGTDVLHFNLHKTFATPHGGGGPGAGPVGVSSKLEPFLPTPRILFEKGKYRFGEAGPSSIGRVKLFWGNFGVLIRAYVYMMLLGALGLKETTELAVLNANYVKEKLKGAYDLPYDGSILHECVFSDHHQQEAGIKTLDIAKRLMDFGFHPPTVYFPLIVHGAIMIEPTETESKREIDEFCDAMLAIARECKSSPDVVKAAPHNTFRARLDEVKAAREIRIKA